MFKIRLPKIGKVDRTYKLRLFIDVLRGEADRLRSEADGLRSEADKLSAMLGRL